MKLMKLLPFMDDEDLKELVTKIKNNEVKGVKLVHLYPFLNRDDIDELVDGIIENGNSKDLYSALPFMSKEKLNEIYDRVHAGELEGFREEALLPFLGRKKIKELIDQAISKTQEEEKPEKAE